MNTLEQIGREQIEKLTAERPIPEFAPVMSTLSMASPYLFRVDSLSICCRIPVALAHWPSAISSDVSDRRARQTFLR